MNPVTTTGTTLDGAVDDVERDGVAVVAGVLRPDEIAAALSALWSAAKESERRGIPTYVDTLDPNSSNVRVFNLVDLDPLFIRLLTHPTADALVTRLLGEHYIVSNFTANIARPGSGSMVVHSDQAAVMPPPWLERQTVNIIWCLTDVRAENGATLHLPGSQRIQRFDEVPADPVTAMVPFEAAAGSIIVMEGRVWHTSGRNITVDEDRALLFGYYTKPFIRPQWNFTATLSPETQATMSPMMRYRLGLDAVQNIPPGGAPPVPQA